MGVARRWVFPIIRIVLIAVIAVALARLAFFPDRPPEDAPTLPTGSIVEPTIPVTVGTITNDVILDATISADPAVPITSTAAGTVNKVFVRVGAVVGAGTPIFDVKVEVVREPTRPDPKTPDAETTPQAPVYRYVEVTASAAGTVSSLGVLEGQNVTIGEAVGQIAPPTFSVSGSLQAAQQYRLLNRPTEASVAITGGPAPFTCTGLKITTPLAGAASGPSPAGGSPEAPTTPGGTATTVTCPVPPGVTVFPGLAAEMTIPGGRAEGVLVVPTTAVRGSAETGAVWIASDEGEAEERPVQLGLNDGMQVEIKGGLVEGEMIREFAPGAEAAVEGQGMGG